MIKKFMFLFSILFLVFGLASCEINLNNNNNNNTNENDDDGKDDGKDDGEDGGDEEEIDPNNPYSLVLTDYYEDLYGNFESTFKSTLSTITKTNHKTKLSYAQAYIALESVDLDTSSGYINCIYTGITTKMLSTDKVNNSSSTNSNKWNREHVWPTSHGDFDSGSYNAYADIHHLHASEEKINGYRGNKDFGEVSDPTSTDIYGNKWNATYFEPKDDVKGNIARALLYMTIRYNDLSDLQLVLVNGNTGSSANRYGYLGDLETLIKWHYEDPVDAVELARHERVVAKQGNRNPFIDYAVFVEILYPEAAARYNS